MTHDILGMNVLVFVLVTWLTIVVAILCADNLPEMYQEWKFVPEMQAKNDPELTVEMETGSFDPDETMKIAVYREHQIKQITEMPLFLIQKRHAVPGRRRHAKA